jgi:tocopherol O-methyltransferase
MDRKSVFARVADSLRPGGTFCVQDVFLENSAYKPEFDMYWKTDVATVDEYVADAADAGLEVDAQVDLTDSTTDFWLHSTAWTEARLRLVGQGHPDHHHLRQSLRYHAIFHRAWQQSAFSVRLLRLRKPGRP